MWFKRYRDYKTDHPLIKEQVEPGHGIVGCEMHEINGWGNEIHQPKKRSSKGLIKTVIFYLFSKKKHE